MTQETGLITQQKSNDVITSQARELAARLKYMVQNGKKLEDAEVFALAHYAAANDLNPFSGECYYLPGVGPCPGIVGWRKKAQDQLDWEANREGMAGAHMWTDDRDAVEGEANFDPKKDIACHVTLHDWLTSTRWRRALFDTAQQLRELGETDALHKAMEIVGREPVWTGVGVVFAEENFGKDRMDRYQRALKRAEKLALRKRFPRVKLPEPVGVDVDAYDVEARELPPLPPTTTPGEPVQVISVEVPTPAAALMPAESVKTIEAFWPKDAKVSFGYASLVTTEDESHKLYLDLESADLAHRATSLNQAIKKNGLTQEQREEKQYRLDTIGAILKARAAQAAQPTII